MKLLTTATPDWTSTATSPGPSTPGASTDAGAVAADAGAVAGFGRAMLVATSPAPRAIPIASGRPAQPTPTGAPAVDIDGMVVAQSVPLFITRAGGPQPTSTPAGLPVPPIPAPADSLLQTVDFAVKSALDTKAEAKPVTESKDAVDPAVTPATVMAVPLRLGGAKTTASAAVMKAARPSSARTDRHEPLGDVAEPPLTDAGASLTMPAEAMLAMASVAPSSPAVSAQVDPAAPQASGHSPSLAEPVAAKSASQIRTAATGDAIAPDGRVAIAEVPSPITAAATKQLPTPASPDVTAMDQPDTSARAIGSARATARPLSDVPAPDTPVPSLTGSSTLQTDPQKLTPLVSVLGQGGPRHLVSVSAQPASAASPASDPQPDTRSTGGPGDAPIIGEAPNPGTSQIIAPPSPLAPPVVHEPSAISPLAVQLTATTATPVTPNANPLVAVVPSVVIATQHPQLAHDVGLAIARQLSAEGNALHIRLEPAELGRIDVRMSFDDQGKLCAVVAADSAASLDVLRRDSADLGRAMTDAGVRADDQSFRFEGRGDGRGGGGNQRQPPPPPSQPFASDAKAVPSAPGSTRFTPLRWRGQVNVLA